MNYFTITTNRETADEIENQFLFDSRMNSGRSIELGEIQHEENYSLVQVKAVDEKIKPEDIFWLGRFSGLPNYDLPKPTSIFKSDQIITLDFVKMIMDSLEIEFVKADDYHFKFWDPHLEEDLRIGKKTTVRKFIKYLIDRSYDDGKIDGDLNAKSEMRKALGL